MVCVPVIYVAHGMRGLYTPPSRNVSPHLPREAAWRRKRYPWCNSIRYRRTRKGIWSKWSGSYGSRQGTGRAGSCSTRGRCATTRRISHDSRRRFRRRIDPCDVRAGETVRCVHLLRALGALRRSFLHHPGVRGTRRIRGKHRKTWIWHEPTDVGFRDEWKRYDPGDGPTLFTIGWGTGGVFHLRRRGVCAMHRAHSPALSAGRFLPQQPRESPGVRGVRRTREEDQRPHAGDEPRREILGL